MGLLSDFFGGTKEWHDDGSSTTRFTDVSVTKDSEGNVREVTSRTTSLPLGFGEELTITKDDEGNVINVQKGWGER